jgi:hypothetical protein
MRCTVCPGTAVHRAVTRLDHFKIIQNHSKQNTSFSLDARVMLGIQ